MKNVTKAIILTVIGFNFAVVSDNALAMNTDQMKVCKAVASVYSDRSLKEHFKARLSLKGVHGTRQDVYVKMAGDIATSQAVNILTNCGLEKRNHARGGTSAIIGKI